ncbi:MAG TPA: hypothetical protein VFL62_18690 [Bradyrhizobium sp.]|uniref:hypothetical protein n=1 Tax=Bradyrhizobium sp. TaxID=376 RepID=UPI002D7F6909|nr:hypothetical protein [Bradyrhizobium sp.]HET7888255.1 hypothetical protein [Bradyrhizobium sp.]
MNRGRMTIAATTLACAAVLSMGLPAGSAQAVEKSEARGASHMRSSEHMASRHMATAPREHMRRHVARGYARGYGPGYRRGYGPNPVEAGADVAAGAVNTAGAVAAGAIGTAGAIAAAPFGGGPYAAAPGYDRGYYGSSTWGDFECSPGYAGCRPYAEKNWYAR